MSFLRTVFVSSLLLVLAVSVAAQEFRATVVGRVTDSSGASVPAAQVSVTNLDTGVVSKAVTTDSGDYVLPALTPGRYKLEIEMPGFKKHVRDNLTLQVQDRPTIDVTLEPGEVTTAITVDASATPLETSTASRGEVITGRALVDLPLNGRNAFALAALTPAVTFTVRGQASTFLRTTANSGISGTSISGGQPRFNESLLDGVPNTGSDGTIQFVPSVDATAEFKVQTNSFDAEFGRFTGGVINATIKSGTNDLHGTLFDFLRNSALNARDPFAASIPQFGYNLFGGSAGGPVVLPKIYRGKNRTFWFFNYEGSREGVPRAFVSTVPTELQRRGDFSQTYARSGATLAPVSIFDPATTRQSGTGFVRDPFPGNAVPSNRFDPVARNMINLYPQANAPGDPLIQANNYLRSFKDAVTDDGVVARIDHRFSDSHALFGRFSWRQFTVQRQGGFKNEVTGDAEHRNAPGVAVDDTITLNPTTVLNFRYGFSRWQSRSAADNVGYDATQFGFPASFTGATLVKAIPQIDIAGFTSLSGANKLNQVAEDAHTLRGGLTKAVDRHSLRFGGEFRMLRSNVGSLGSQAAGQFSFDQVFTRGPNPQASVVTAGYSLASFLLGLAASGNTASNAQTAEQGTYFGFYFMDDYRITQKLTLNLGIRYEWEGPYTERYNRLNRGYDFATASPIAAQAKASYAQNPIPEVQASQFQVNGGLLFAGAGGLPRGITDIDRNNLAPRIGAAYSITSNTVLRGGYGIFYGATTLLSETRQGFSVNTPFVGTIDGSLTPVNRLSNPYPDGLLNPPGSSLGLMTLVGQGVGFVDVGRKSPLAHQYSFGVQHQLPWNTLVDLGYSGSASRDLAVDRQIDFIPDGIYSAARQTFINTGRNVLNDSVTNPFFGLIASGPLSGRTTTRGQLVRPFPHFTSITSFNQSIGSNRFDSFQAKVTKRFSGGISLITAYAKMKLLQQTRFLNEQDTALVKELPDYDISQRLSLSGLWELPLGRGRKLLSSASGVTQKLVEGWQVNVIYAAQSGVPLVLASGESLGRSAEISSGQQTIQQWFDTSAFRLRQPLEYAGTAVLPDVRSAGKNNWDISLYKTTPLTEWLKLQFRAESFNAMNRPEYSSPNTTFGNPNFGRVTSTNTFARQYQFALKLLW